MRIVIHDYAGHTFQVQLSRYLASQGHEVLHLYCADIVSPRGNLATGPDGLIVEPVSIGQAAIKYAPFRRYMQERTYGRRLAQRVLEFGPDIVLTANTPPFALARLMKMMAPARVPVIVWVQDIFFPGIAQAVETWPRPLAALAGSMVKRTELGALRNALGLVLISTDFVSLLHGHGLDHPRAFVIENWAPLDDLPQRPRNNSWSALHGLDEAFVFLYAGTLGKKHNPALLARLAEGFTDDPQVRIVVVSQGIGRSWLEERKRTDKLDNLILLDFQAYAALPDVLATADVNVVLLEDYAGALSVPSKVYSALCAGRPILAAVPNANLARRVIEAAKAGFCVAPNDEKEFLASARRLRGDAALRADLAANQHAYAEKAFDIRAIGLKFEAVLSQ